MTMENWFLLIIYLPNIIMGGYYFFKDLTDSSWGFEPGIEAMFMCLLIPLIWYFIIPYALIDRYRVKKASRTNTPL